MSSTESSSAFLPRAISASRNSVLWSKWSSMADLPRPVTKTNSSMPDARASSTAYWMSGLSTTGSISLGRALVAGRNRVPRPPTGKIALRIGRVMQRFLSESAGTVGRNATGAAG